MGLLKTTFLPIFTQVIKPLVKKEKPIAHERLYSSDIMEICPEQLKFFVSLGDNVQSRNFVKENDSMIRKNCFFVTTRKFSRHTKIAVGTT